MPGERSIRCSLFQRHERGQANGLDAFDMRPKRRQQSLASFPVDTLRPPQVSHVVPVPHEGRGGKLQRGVGCGSQAGGNFCEARDQCGRGDHEAQTKGWTEGLAEGANVNHSPDPVERCQRWGRATYQLQLAQVVVLNDPSLARIRPFEQGEAPSERQGASQGGAAARR